MKSSIESVNNLQIRPLSDAIKFHGHLCPGLTMGYRVSQRAMQELCSGRAEDEELVAIVENDSCAVDGVQYVTGCTLGKGNLIFRDLGKHVYTFINRQTGKAVRISIRSDFDTNTLVSSPSEDKMEQKRRVAMKVMEVPDDLIFTVTEVEPEVPEKARIFRSVICARCGEKVSESRARLQDGEIVCIPCYDHYSRGW